MEKFIFCAVRNTEYTISQEYHGKPNQYIQVAKNKQTLSSFLSNNDNLKIQVCRIKEKYRFEIVVENSKFWPH